MSVWNYGHKFVCLFPRCLDGAHRLADVGTRCPWCGQTLVGTTLLGPDPGGDNPTWPEGQPPIPPPSLNVGRAHMVPARPCLVTHISAATLGYHSQCGRASAYTSYTENSVWPHFESILPGVPPPPPPPKHTTQHPRWRPTLPTPTPHPADQKSGRCFRCNLHTISAHAQHKQHCHHCHHNIYILVIFSLVVIQQFLLMSKGSM